LIIEARYRIYKEILAEEGTPRYLMRGNLEKNESRGWGESASKTTWKSGINIG